MHNVTVKKPDGIDCPTWEPVSDGQRACRHYVKPQMCGLADGFVCTEWLKRNNAHADTSIHVGASQAEGQSKADNRPPTTLDLLSEPAVPRPGAPQASPIDAEGHLRLLPAQPQPRPRKGAAAAAAKRALEVLQGDVPPELRGAEFGDFEPAKKIPDERTNALTEFGAEFELGTDGMEISPKLPLVLVPKRTGRTDRHEIDFADAATLRLVVDAFPGARVVAFRRPQSYLPHAPANETDDSALVATEDSRPVLAAGRLRSPEEMPSRALCSVCMEPQRQTPSGMVCKNGHGGAPAHSADLAKIPQAQTALSSPGGEAAAGAVSIAEGEPWDA